VALKTHDLSGRDDKFARQSLVSMARTPTFAANLSSRPERTRISYLAELATTTDAALRKESRTNFINATKINTKSGVAQWRDLQFLFLVFPQPVDLAN
jgi:hypothetical protein